MTLIDTRAEVRALRQKIGDTQQSFAHRLGLSISTVVRWELTRPPRNHSLVLLRKVAAEHGLDDLVSRFDQAMRVELGERIVFVQLPTPESRSVTAPQVTTTHDRPTCDLERCSVWL